MSNWIHCCREFAAALKKREDWKGLSPNYSIYSLARVKDKEIRLGFFRHFPLDVASAENQESQFVMSEEVDLRCDMEVSIVPSELEKFDGHFMDICLDEKEKDPIRKKRDLNEPLILILISLLDLNNTTNMTNFIKAMPSFTEEGE